MVVSGLVELLHSPLLLAVLLSLLVAVVVSGWTKPSLHGRDGRRLPPSPRGSLPVLGHLTLLGALPHRALRALAAVHGPVMLLCLGCVPTVVASSATVAEEAMKTRDKAFGSRPRLRVADRLFYGFRDMVFAPTGEHWHQGRRICVNHLLNPRRVHSLRHVREQEVAAMLGRVRVGAAVNLSNLFIIYTNAIISRATFGDRDYGAVGDGDGGGDLRKVFGEFEELLGTIPMGEVVPWLWWVDIVTGLERKTRRTFQEMDRLLERVIADHHQRRRGGRQTGDDGENDPRDFVDVLLDVSETDAEAGIRLDTVGIKALLMDMVVAATDTSYTLLEWTMAELINHPDKMRKLQDEIRAAAGEAGHISEDHLTELNYLKAVIKETLRLHPPAPLLVPRETVEDTELLGYHVPARTRVLINVWAIGRDPVTWGERAEEFEPERFVSGSGGDQQPVEYHKLGQDFGFVPFGAGRRGCPGVGFSVPSTQLALASLMYHFDWEPPVGGGRSPPLDMSEVHGLAVRMKAALVLVAKPWPR
ncbi:hypothetical protein ABZP36_007157 [Zizania latifolia]